MRYITMRCPTALGWTERLLSSDDYAQHEVEWRLEPTADGSTDLTYRVRVALAMPGVQSLVVRKLSTSMVLTVDSLLALLPGDPDQ